MATLILEKKSGSGSVKSRIQHVIHGDPTLGSYASYWMMKNELRQLDEDWLKEHTSRWDQLKFNTNFLERTLATHGEYCGKPNLIIYAWNHIGPKVNMATADHFIPKSLDREKLTFDISNLRVACNKCNNKKADHVWDDSTLRYRYK